MRFACARRLSLSPPCVPCRVALRFAAVTLSGVANGAASRPQRYGQSAESKKRKKSTKSGTFSMQELRKLFTLQRCDTCETAGIVNFAADRASLSDGDPGSDRQLTARKRWEEYKGAHTIDEQCLRNAATRFPELICWVHHDRESDMVEGEAESAADDGTERARGSSNEEPAEGSSAAASCVPADGKAAIDDASECEFEDIQPERSPPPAILDECVEALARGRNGHSIPRPPRPADAIGLVFYPSHTNTGAFSL